MALQKTREDFLTENRELPVENPFLKIETGKDCSLRIGVSTIRWVFLSAFLRTSMIHTRKNRADLYETGVESAWIPETAWYRGLFE